MTMNPPIKFGANGWRGILDDVFNERNLIRVAEAFARYLIAEKQSDTTVAIGFDGRKYSKDFATLFARILSAQGFSVLLSEKIIPTPVLSFTLKKYSCAAGIMITASHNSAQYNGIKFKGSFGGPFLRTETKKVFEFLRESVDNKQSSDRIEIKNFLPEYTRHIQTLVDFDVLRKFALNPANNPSVMIDSMGGAGQTILEEILVDAGWRAQTIFGSAEPNFYDRLPEPIEKNLEPLKYNTSVTDAIFGIATDGDADRCSIVFEDGKWMTAQENILTLLWHLHENKKWNGAIIKSASVTDKVRLLAEQWRSKVYDVNVGFSSVTEVMLKEDFMFGAEESGGFGFKNHVPDRDGILSGLMFCEMIAQTEKSLYQILDEIELIVGKFHFGRIDIHVHKKDRGHIFSKLFQSPIDLLMKFPIQDKEVFSDDGEVSGVKYICGDCRWLFIRASQTEPLVRIYAEGQNESEMKRLLEEGKRLIDI